MERHEGGCLCGAIRYETRASPERVTVCHCQFCQRATGSAYMVEPIFDAADFGVIKGAPRTYDAVSAGSGKQVHVHFCADCGTKLWLSFERFPGKLGLYAGTFDDPCWFEIAPERSKHIFLSEARRDTVIPAGIPTFARHVVDNEGTAQEVTVFESCQVIGTI
ncbi:GFA family protein [Thioclava sp. FR2]|uniref:GFA family protein n=1 Tax=Thioclava sp. FR2 TaxID=3445780 RepID=UPI003EBDC1EB